MKSGFILLYTILTFQSLAGSYTITCSFVEIQSGKAIAGLEVELRYNSSLIASALTDSEGQCDFENLKKEVYQLHVQNMQDVYESGPIQIINTSKIDKAYTITVRWNADTEEDMLEAAKLRDAPLIKAAIEKQKAAAEANEGREEEEDEDEAPESTYEDQEASFPGGAAKMQGFVAQAVRYPSAAVERGDQGRVFLTFVVEGDGSIDMIRVERGISPELDREAMLVILYMPKWIPGTYRGEPARTFCRMPINFDFD